MAQALIMTPAGKTIADRKGENGKSGEDSKPGTGVFLHYFDVFALLGNS